ncbi:MAG: polysaccharide biosynthesis protein [Desulfovermiculus sp.]|nr:polysaccharide biosynthesis protein [Desulfovermiculus sp.]
MLSQLMNRNFYLMLGIDAVFFVLALLVSYLIRFDFVPPADHWQNFWATLPWAISVKLVLFYAFGLYKGMWRFTGLSDIWRLAQACFVAEAGVVAVVTWLHRFAGYSRGVFVMDAVLTFVLAGGLRLAIRSYYGHQGQMSLKSLWGWRKKRSGGHRCLILGAGNTGEQILREMLHNPDLGYEPVGFLDDNLHKKGRNIHGLPVLGPIQDVRRVVDNHQVDEVLIALPAAGPERIKEVVRLCEQAKVTFKTLPSMGELINGRVSVTAFRDVDVHDLLGRRQVKVDDEAISDCVQDKVVLIAGVGRMIGSELVRQVVAYEPAQVILIDWSEPDLYAVEMELVHEIGFVPYQTVLGYVHDKDLISQLFAQYHPQVVIQAAGPTNAALLEENPWVAVDNNILASQVLMQAAAEYQAERFVLVSSDQAAEPDTVMAASKRVAEVLMQSMPKDTTIFSAVRLGRILSRYVSMFQNQIEKNTPIRVPDPEMTCSTLPASQVARLILQAMALGQGGEIFVLNMMDQVRIADMAREMIRLSGRKPSDDITIQYTGLEFGEQIAGWAPPGDEAEATEHPEIMVLRPESDPFDQNGTRRNRLPDLVDGLSHAAKTMDKKAIEAGLRNIVPEYTGSDTLTVLQLREKKKRG